MEVVNKSDLVKYVSLFAISKNSADRIVSIFVDKIVTELRAGKRVRISGFGTFVPTIVPAHAGMDPKTRKPLRVPKRVKVKFKPGRHLQGIDPKIVEV